MAVSAADTPLEKVTLQLKWTHQFQFAGYYMAVHNGHYGREGLDVTILPGGPTLDVTEQVVSGKADFGVGTSGLLLDYAGGNPVVVLGVIYQHSPLVLIMRADRPTSTLEDLLDKPIMMEEHSADLLTMFKWAGLPAKRLNLIGHTGRPEDLYKNGAYAISAYVTDEPYELDEMGFKYNTFSPRTYGIDFYGDNFFTRRDLLEERETMVERFRTATIRGWQDALRDPEQAVDVILRHYATRKTREHLLFEARATESLMTRLVTPGYMLRGRWEHIADTYLEADMLDERPDLDGFIYQSETTALPPWFWKVALATVCLVGVLTVIAVHFRNLTARSKREIARRRATEERLEASNRDLKTALAEVRALRGILPICAHCKKIRNDRGEWEQLEAYILTRSEAEFTHGICSECESIYYADDGGTPRENTRGTDA